MAGCNQGLPYNLTVKISGCTDEEFTCDDGQCVGIEERCDQVIHCRDQTDEQDCRLLVLKKGYKKNIVPFTIVSQSTSPNSNKYIFSLEMRFKSWESMYQLPC